ncbi:hypothetical protein F5Y15DRAFT_110961 [Xylariaceae sp. FL0016]|nr:hypothetical protein F5Y15DRAFT_110961 [Xylariaceae sp. FL0016]
MADDWEQAQQDAPRSSRPTSKKSSSPGQDPEPLPDKDSASPDKFRPRSSSVIYSSDAISIPTVDECTIRVSMEADESDHQLLSDGISDLASKPEKDEGPHSYKPRNGVHAHLASPSNDFIPVDVAAQTSESSSSSGSGSTITPTSSVKRDSTAKAVSKAKKHSAHKPDALSFLDSDSPQITPETIERTMHEASQRSPDSVHSTSPSTRSTSSTLSSFRDDASDTIGDHETDRSTSPERSVDGDRIERLSVNTDPRLRAGKNRKRSYGTPEMPRGNAQHPHISPNALTPRVPNQNQPYAKHLPRAEKLPLTGYEQLASKLSSASSEQYGPYLRPMYRRFETLNHRLLLHLQDEICELEEQLHRLDTADTQNRRLQNCILPASRRAESLSGGELHWHKTDILGKIGFKLEQYNRVLVSFQKTQHLQTPTLADIHEYRGYLATHAPIVELEARFLDATDDLVCVDEDEQVEPMDEDTMVTPMPRPEYNLFSPRNSQPAKPQAEATVRQDDIGCEASKGAVTRTENEPLVASLSLAMAIAILLPIMTFSVIPSYLGRVTVASLVGGGVLGALIQGKVVGIHATREFCVCVGIYGAAMAMLAGIVT